MMDPAEESGNYAEAILLAIDEVVGGQQFELHPLLFALAAVQALYIGGVENPDVRAELMDEVRDVLASQVEMEREAGVADCMGISVTVSRVN